MSDQSQAIDNKPSIDLIQKVSFMDAPVGPSVGDIEVFMGIQDPLIW